ncbi:MAG: porin family protein [Candidatus Omnitrophota bacterium]|nr:MAG: porin family protein [Candidatus Omnitrophota bacterium]
MSRKLLFFVAVFLVTLLAVPGAAFCQDKKNKWALGYRYSYVDADDADFKTHGNAHDLIVGYELTDNFAVEAEAGHFRLKSKSGTGLDVVTAHASLQLRLPSGKFVPYLSGGAGWMFYDYGTLYADDEKDNRNSFSYKAGAGMDFLLTEKLAFGGEVSYVYGNTGGGATLDVYHWRYGVGFKYYF